MKTSVLRTAARVLPYFVPLSIRKGIVIWLANRKSPKRYRLSFFLLQDFARSDPDGFHRFLWSNHRGHAGTYEVAQRYGDENIEPTRRILFEEICSALRTRGVTPERDVRSVFDAGCSLGHVLRMAETRVFPSAVELRGVDVDSYAIHTGSAYLQQIGSIASRKEKIGSAPG